MTQGFTRILSLLMVSLALPLISAATETNAQAKFASAAALLQAHKAAEALPILEELGRSNPSPSVFWNLGLSAAEVGNHAVALQAWRAYRALDASNWQVRAKLIQTHQALGDLQARDQERTDLIALWQAGTDKSLSAQPIFCREQFIHEGRKVMVLEYFRPSGPNAVVYSFMVINESGQQDFKISLGSYEQINQIALELGQRPKDQRLYHLDLYRPAVHETHGMYLGQPGYDVIRPTVLEVLPGKHQQTPKVPAPVPVPAPAEELTRINLPLQKTLLNLRQIDQSSLREKKLSPEQLAEIFRMNQSQLSELVKQHGWPTLTAVGNDAAQGAWLIVQHADHDRNWQREMLGLMEALLAQGEVRKPDVAYLRDRLDVADKQRQRFGTQGKCIGKNIWQPFELADASQVDDWRKSMEMTSLKAYVDRASTILCGKFESAQ